MRRLFLLTFLVCCFGLSSCQCSEKPDIGPVEGEDTKAQVPTPTPKVIPDHV